MSSSSCTDGLARRAARLAVGVAASLAAALAHGAELDAGGRAARLAVQVVPFDRLRFGATIRQGHDFSCGAAAVATLLTFHFDAPTREDDVFGEMWERGDQTRIRAQGFSLLDLKSYLAGHGYDADGFRVSLDELRKAELPAIALVTVGGYRHFVVVKGIREAEVAIGDPARGTRVLPRAEFEAMRDEILFVIRGQPAPGRARFNSERDWSAGLSAPLESARQGDAALARLLRPGPNDL